MNIERLLLRFYALHLDFNDVKNRPSYLACQPNETMDIVHLPIFSAIYWQLQASATFFEVLQNNRKILWATYCCYINPEDQNILSESCYKKTNQSICLPD